MRLDLKYCLIVLHGTQQGNGDGDVLGVTYVCPSISLENLKQQVEVSDEVLDRWTLVRHWRRNGIALLFLIYNKEIGEEWFSTGSHLYEGHNSRGTNLMLRSLLPSISTSCTINLTVLAVTVCQKSGIKPKLPS